MMARGVHIDLVLVGTPQLRDIGVATQVMQNLHFPPHILNILC